MAFSGPERAAQLPGNRIISAQKGLDASSWSGGSGSLKGLSVSTANSYATVLPGGTNYGLQHRNPVDVNKTYAGNPDDFGTAAILWWGTSSAASMFLAAALRLR